ncbi:HAD-IA family hydrolase [Microbacteriaceae bacterium]|nr:HAD-IA family hydrolase [Candidatus Saccharibacteria bacterium]
MIRGIIFDCFGVLYGSSVATLVGMCPKDRLQELRDYNIRVDYGFITTEEYAASVAEILSVTKEEVTQLFKAKHVRNNELIEYVKTLRGDYKVALLSNVGTNTIERLFTEQEIEELFDVVVLSYEEHLAKPNPAIFSLTAERMGLSSGECIMVDDIESNCDGAEIVGMYTVRHITNDGTRKALETLMQKNA